MTNILLLPQIQATFNIIDNAGWYDAIAFKLSDGMTVLDITGIGFKGSMRASTEASQIVLSISTDFGGLINGGANGVLLWDVQPDLLRGIKAGKYVFDLLATGDGKTLNLFQKAGPATVEVKKGVTR